MTDEMQATRQKGRLSQLLRAFKKGRRRVSSAGKGRTVTMSEFSPARVHGTAGPEYIATLKSRWELAKLLPPRGIGIELGVATGTFSELLLSRSDLTFLYSVDSYAHHKHDIEEYKLAIRTLARFKERNTILRMTFDQAISLFPDEYFDLVYIDGFAEFGEEDGKILYDWFPKVRRGGVFAGHDYSPRWPRVIEGVDCFIDEKRLDLFIVGGTEEPIDRANRFASWFTFRR